MGNFDLLKEIALDTGQSKEVVIEIVRAAPYRYKVFDIPKKGRGFRTIAQPARELKAVQRSIANLVLCKFPVHDCAMAYRQGISISDNANIHAGSNPILKLDFEKFFNNITASAWVKFLRRQNHVSLSDKEIAFITFALFWGDGGLKPSCLSIGAPTSPLVSNIILFDFDSSMSAFASKNSVNYTRYADDITVSSSSVSKLKLFEEYLRMFIKKNLVPRLIINEKKRALYSPAIRRMVTGLVLTPEGAVSLGRGRKREISSLIHRYTHNELDNEKLAYLHGMLAFALSAEPEFVTRMRKKYGNDVVASILRYRVPRGFIEFI